MQGDTAALRDASARFEFVSPSVAEFSNAGGTAQPLPSSFPRAAHPVGLVLVPAPELAEPTPLLLPDEGLVGAGLLRRIVKRSVDIVCASIALLLLVPLFVAVAIAVGTTSPGPVFYRQERVGRDGRHFRFIKFRTMHADADSVRHQLLEQNEANGPIFKMRQDPRITNVGRILRKFSLDELPQLLHVLSGKMSMVGPRPPLPEEVTAYGPWERQRLLVKPGITCVWQVSGRSDLDFDTWVSMDVEYIRTWSLWRDLAIMVRTPAAVLSGRGAY